VIEMRQGQLLVGSNQPIAIDIDTWRARALSPEVTSYLGANNARKLAEALGTARVAERPDLEDLNHDLFPRDEFKVGSDDP
jgi:hypothetical protein